VVERLVLTNCDSFNTFPPFRFNLRPPIARLPGGMTMLQVRSGSAQSPEPLTGCRRSGRSPPSWSPLGQRQGGRARSGAIPGKLLAGIHKRQTLEASERLKAFDRPALLTWGVDDRFFKLELAERLRETIPDSRLELVEDAKTFSPLDQPRRIGGLIAEFLRARAKSPAAE
jgi:pimeloyl-ACP methyl ester carboxylesterase